MPSSDSDQGSEAPKGQQRMQGEAVADVRQADHGIVTMHVGREDAGGPDVEGRQRDQGVTQQARATDWRPGNGSAVVMGFGAIPPECLVPPVEAQGDAGGDVSGEREGDE